MRTTNTKLNSLIAHSLNHNNAVNVALRRRSGDWKINRQTPKSRGLVAGRIPATENQLSGSANGADGAAPASDEQGVASENFSASNSATCDADFAAQTASLTRYQILCRSAQAVLSHPFVRPRSFNPMGWKTNSRHS